MQSITDISPADIKYILQNLYHLLYISFMILMLFVSFKQNHEINYRYV